MLGENVFLINQNNNVVLYNNDNGKVLLVKGYNTDKLIADYKTGQLNTEINKAISRFLKDGDTGSYSIPIDISYEQLYLIITENCNIACKYCRQHDPGVEKTMTIDEIDQAIELFLRVSKNPKSMVLYGGEVLLYPELVIHAVKKFRENVNQSAAITIITNGMLMTPEVALELKRNDVTVVFSIDGPEHINDKARTSVGNVGSYERSVKGYRICKELNMTVGISSTIGPHNEKHLDEICAWLIDLNPDSVGFGLPHGDFQNYAYQINSFQNLYYKLFDIYRTLKEHGISYIHIERKIRDVALNKTNLFECRACHSRLVICPGYRYGTCEGAVTDSRMFFDTLIDVKRQAYQFQEIAPLTRGECKKCIAKRVCGGGCPYDNLLRFKSAIKQDESRCMFNKMLVEFALYEIGKEVISVNQNEEEYMEINDITIQELSNSFLIESKNLPLVHNSNVEINV